MLVELILTLAIPLGLDLYLPVPEDNPLTIEKIEADGGCSSTPGCRADGASLSSPNCSTGRRCVHAISWTVRMFGWFNAGAIPGSVHLPHPTVQSGPTISNPHSIEPLASTPAIADSIVSGKSRMDIRH